MTEALCTQRKSPLVRLILDPQRRPRRGWRVLAYLVLLIAVTAPLAAMGRGSLWANLVAHATVAGAAIGLTYVFRRHVDRRAWRDIGLGRPRWRDAAVGGALGVAAILVYFAATRVVGWSRVTGTELSERGPAAMLALLSAGLFMYATSAVFQEVAFRGYVLQTLADGWSMRGAAVASSLIFAALHFSGVPTPLFALVLLADLTLMACFFVLTRLSSGALWLAIGFHTTWNWTQDYIFSLDTAAGADYGNSLVHVRLHTPQLLLGPDGGAELLYLLTSAVLFGGYWVFTRRQGTRRNMAGDP